MPCPLPSQAAADDAEARLGMSVSYIMCFRKVRAMYGTRPPCVRQPGCRTSLCARARNDRVKHLPPRSSLFGTTIGSIISFSFCHIVLLCLQQELSVGSANEELSASLPWRRRIMAVGLDSTELGNPPSKFKQVSTYSKAMERMVSVSAVP